MDILVSVKPGMEQLQVKAFQPLPLERMHNISGPLFDIAMGMETL